LRIPSYGWVLFDGYGPMTGFDGAALKTPSLIDSFSVVVEGYTYTNAIPVLWLEHAEYTGLTYNQTMARWRQYRSVCNQTLWLRTK
jgi:hypothetical protein